MWSSIVCPGRVKDNQAFSRLDRKISGFIESESRYRDTLSPETIDEYVREDNLVSVIDVVVDDLDLAALNFKIEPADTGRLTQHPGA